MTVLTGEMKERHHAGGHVLSDSVQRGDWRPKKRAHRLNVRIDEDLYRELVSFGGRRPRAGCRCLR